MEPAVALRGHRCPCADAQKCDEFMYEFCRVLSPLRAVDSRGNVRLARLKTSIGMTVSASGPSAIPMDAAAAQALTHARQQLKESTNGKKSR